MKKGFALLETIIVITFLAVSLLLLYGTFSNMVSNNKKNVLYDDASNIYKAYYMKEYLKNYGLLEKISNEKIKEIKCEDFENSGCKTLQKAFEITKIYIVSRDIKGYQEEKFDSNLNNYLKTLSDNIKEENRLVIEIEKDNTYSYASIGINGDENE